MHEHEEAKRREARTPENERKKILVTVLECRDLRRMDGRFGNNDVFVKVAVEQPIPAGENGLAASINSEREVVETRRTDILYK